MYYIVNPDNQVVAADSDFLSWLKIDDLQELFVQLARSELKFNELDSSTLEVVTDINTVTLTQNRYPLSTLMGDLLLVKVSEIKEATFAPVNLLEATDNEVKFIIDDEEETDKGINLLPDEEIDFLKPVEEIADESIIIDTEKVSEILGITKGDYSGFFDEFIDKAIELEEAVRDTDSTEHHQAISSLCELAQMLHLTALSNILEKAEKESGEKEKSAIEAFYHALSNLTTHMEQSNNIALELEEGADDNQICGLVLDKLKPIHFDFQIEKASEELSLPVDLIEEFVNDFIVQVHEEKKSFIEACKKGDIDAIHQIGHKLKGVASNLRINPLAETLEEIQLCEERSRFEPLLKKYWGQFLAFELYMHGKLQHRGKNK